MPSIKELSPDKWLNPEIIKGHRLQVTIEAVRIEELFNPTSPKQEKRLTVKFYNKELRMILNKTQAFSLASVCATEDWSKWVGHSVVISVGRAPNGKDIILISPVPDTPQPMPSIK
jgi:hypothetical protein